MPEWTDPGLRAEAVAWIHEQLERRGMPLVGELDHFHTSASSTVIRAPTATGDVYFKANVESQRHESALVEVLATRRPDCLPALVAVDHERGWLLMADAGTPLRSLVAQEGALTRWLDVLPLYAGVQIDLVRDAGDLVTLGVPDRRLAALPALCEGMLHDLGSRLGDEGDRLADAMPRVGEMCDELAAYGIPETIEHDDLHDGQVYVNGERYMFLDWGEACVSHPFFTMAVTLEGVIAWGSDDTQGSIDTTPFRDAYLRPFSRFGQRRRLEDACAVATRVGWVCRAVNAHLAGSKPAETRVRLRMFLDGHP